MSRPAPAKQTRSSQHATIRQHPAFLAYTPQSLHLLFFFFLLVFELGISEVWSYTNSNTKKEKEK